MKESGCTVARVLLASDVKGALLPLRLNWGQVIWVGLVELKEEPVGGSRWSVLLPSLWVISWFMR